MPLLFTPFLFLAISPPTQTVGGEFQTLYKWAGRAAGDHFGAAVSNAGDVNGDGFEDLVVGARFADPGGRIDAGTVYVYSGLDGSVLHTWHGAKADDIIGNTVSGAGDVNGDGFDDVIVSAQRADPGGMSKAGSALVYSGADGSLLYQWDGESAFDQFGGLVSGAGDVNCDGYDDLLVGALFADPGGRIDAGSAYLFSGANGTLLYQWNGQMAHDVFGQSVSNAGDVNADGVPDLVVGAQSTDPGGQQDAGSAFAFSGADGSLLYVWDGQASDDRLGYSVSDAGDFNGDGFDDVIVGAPDADPGGLSKAGSAYVFSGLDGSLLNQWNGTVYYGNFGFSVSSAGDVNRDGFDDVIVGAFRAGSVFVFSGADGSLLHQWNEGVNELWFGFSVSGAGDVNADGWDDLVVGAHGSSHPGGLSQAGTAYVFSFNPFLRSSANQISIAAGGVIELQLDFPDLTAGYEYKVLASSSGTGPTTFGVDIPLTDDPLVRRSYLGLYAGALEGRLRGTLDSEGKAIATIRISSGNWPELIGMNFYLAAIAMKFGGLPEYSSVAVTVTILP